MTYVSIDFCLHSLEAKLRRRTQKNISCQALSDQKVFPFALLLHGGTRESFSLAEDEFLFLENARKFHFYIFVQMIKETLWAVLRCFASAGRSHRLNCNFPSTESLLSVTLIFRSNVTRNRRRRFSNGSTPCWASPFRRVTTRTSCATESFCASSPTNWHRDASRRSRSAEQTSNWWKMFKGKNFYPELSWKFFTISMF